MGVEIKDKFGHPIGKQTKGIMVISLSGLIGAYIGNLLNKALGYSDVGTIGFTVCMTVFFTAMVVFRKLNRI